MAWTPVNVDITKNNIDHVLGIPGLCELVAQHVSKETFCSFNIFSKNNYIAPDGFDRYILGFWFEVFDDVAFLKLYNDNPQAEFIILSDMLPNDLTKLSRCKYLQLFHWNWFLNQYKTQSNTQQKKYKISSLSNRVNEYKFFITAALLNQPDVYLTWNAEYCKHISYYDYIFSSTGYPKRDNLLIYAEKLRNPVNKESFVNDPEVHFLTSWSHPAYTDSLVNFINETKDNSWQPEFGLIPGPYLTEKTWKPLFLGNALVFSGQHNIKSVLEEAGFNFNYPWQDNYSHLPGDLERLDCLLELIDTILALPAEEIQSGIENSISHNQNLISSKQIHCYVDEKNQVGLELLTKLL